MKKLLFPVLALAASMSAGAAHLSPEAALESVLANQGQQKVKGAAAEYRLTYTTGNGEAYAFNRSDNGFIIVSADSDNPMPLLGYSDNGAIDPDNMPPAMIWWLDLLSQSRPAQVNAPQREARQEIAPILTTQWGQGNPYNLDCPKLGITRTPTGCVATAAAQIMKHWNHPAKGTGSITYTWDAGKKDITYNFGNTTFEWDQMIDNYQTGGTTAQRAAVAELMYAVGCAAQMQYTTQASGAVDFIAGAGLVEYLGYDKALVVAMRDTYAYDAWKELIYNELKSGRPILYSGTGNLGGHAFVCDGYRYLSDADMFHINWGWDGMSDGYFQLNDLSPEELGTGGGGGNFNYAQSAFIGMKPAVAGSEYVPNFIVLGKLGSDKPSYSRTSKIYICSTTKSESFDVGGFYSFSVASLPVTFGLRLTTSGKEPVYITSTLSGIIQPGTGTRVLEFKAADFPTEGNWDVRPLIKYNNVWYDFRDEVTNRAILTAECTADKITFTQSDNSNELVFSDMVIDNKVIIDGEASAFSIEATAKGESYKTDVIPALLNGSKVYATAETKHIDIAAGEKASLEWNSRFTRSNGAALAAGSYSLSLIDANGNTLYGPVAVVVANADEQLELSLSSVKINRTAANATEAVAVSGTSLTVAGSLKCTAGYLDDEVSVYILDSDRKVIKELTEPKALLLGKGASKSLSFRGNFDGLEIGKTYYATFRIAGTDNDIDEQYPFSVADSGIESITIDQTADAVFYNLQGARVATPCAGNIYIMQRPLERPVKVIVR